jgi:hypothetical protein
VKPRNTQSTNLPEVIGLIAINDTLRSSEFRTRIDIRPERVQARRGAPTLRSYSRAIRISPAWSTNVLAAQPITALSYFLRQR